MTRKKGKQGGEVALAEAVPDDDYELVPRHPSGRPVVKYGPVTSYPNTAEKEQELLDKLWQYAYDGHSLYSTCRFIGIPYSTLRSWAEKDYGTKLRECLQLCKDLRLGAMQELEHRNLNNKDFNTTLFKFAMQARHPEIYREPEKARPDQGLGQSQIDAARLGFEMTRLMKAALHEIELERDRRTIDVSPESKGLTELCPTTT